MNLLLHWIVVGEALTAWMASKAGQYIHSTSILFTQQNSNIFFSADDTVLRKLQNIEKTTKLQQKLLASNFRIRSKVQNQFRCPSPETIRNLSSISNGDCLPTVPVEEVKQPDPNESTWCQTSMTDTFWPYYQNQEPVVFRKAVALSRDWKDWDYLCMVKY